MPQAGHEHMTQCVRLVHSKALCIAPPRVTCYVFSLSDDANSGVDIFPCFVLLLDKEQRAHISLYPQTNLEISL